MVLEASEDFPRGRAVVLNQKYEIELEIAGLEELEVFDFHEFKILPGGKTALACAHWAKEISLEEIGHPDKQSFFTTAGFYEFDLATGKKLTWWDASAPGNIALHESVHLDNSTEPEESPGHDYLHINSVEKDGNGDYLVSMRFTNTIYLVSGIDGTIKWRLGGQETDFDQDFKFSKQHDARVLEQNGNRYVISLFNNASDDKGDDEDVSSVLVVELNMSASPKTARLIRRYDRPDHRLSRLRGSAQKLPNGNIFVSWSDDGYISEFSSEGTNLMEARFMTTGFYNYRAYKYEFTGRPAQPPAVFGSVAGSERNKPSTTIYVSWNGATDVASWNLHVQEGEGQAPYLIANIKKTAFETVHIAEGYIDWISAEALDQNGVSLGRSNVSRSTWNTAGTEETELRDSQPKPAHDVAEYVDQSRASNKFLTFSSFMSILGLLSIAAVAVRLLRPWLWPRIYSCIASFRQILSRT